MKEYLATSTMRRGAPPASDPAAEWTGAYLIDVKFGVILDVEASRAIRQPEVGAASFLAALCSRVNFSRMKGSLGLRNHLAKSQEARMWE